MSYFLSGHWPYYTGATHPNELLQMKLENTPTDVSLVEQVKAACDPGTTVSLLSVCGLLSCVTLRSQNTTFSVRLSLTLYTPLFVTTFLFILKFAVPNHVFCFGFLYVSGFVCVLGVICLSVIHALVYVCVRMCVRACTCDHTCIYMCILCV